MAQGAQPRKQHEDYPDRDRTNFCSIQHDSTLVADLKSCGHLQDLNQACRLHVDILKRGSLDTNLFVGASLISVYARCGAVWKSRQVFDSLRVRDIVCWTSLITGYAQHGYAKEAFSCLERMQEDGFSPNSVTFTGILKVCGLLKALKRGKWTHVEIARRGLLADSTSLGNALVDMYLKLGAVEMAKQVFNELPKHNVVSWTTIISGYCQHGQNAESLECFEQMQCEGLSPDSVTLLCLVQACTGMADLERGREVHANAVREDLLGRDHVLCNALIDMYAKCGALSRAQELFSELGMRTVVSWTSLLSGFSQLGYGKEAINCLENMEAEGFRPNAMTFACALKACGFIGAVEEGKRIHCEIVKEGLLRGDDMLGTALLDMYAKCRAIAEVQQTFDQLQVQDIVSWTTLIAGYSLHGFSTDALKCLHRMQVSGFSPDNVTWVCILRACRDIGAVEKGHEIHMDIIKECSVGDISRVSSILIDMYAKCGALAKAQDVFDNLSVRSVEVWTALCSGYARFGKHEQVFELYDSMIRDGVKPSGITFIVMINLCRNLGLVDKGQRYFQEMSEIHGMLPTPEHLTCMVDLFGTAGQFSKAIEMIEQGLIYNYLPAWYTLLRACRRWGNVLLGRKAFNHLICLEKNVAAAYACMSSIYIAAGMMEEANMTKILGNKALIHQFKPRCCKV
ncbi:hypothetical protein KP509_30G007900 [Ceratopteris richardii]|uniref:Pentatricopeptide repeat-containing protein n=1 Tax=Ceratopteris richardii TaxID=49495 RepID=A0A8T2QZG1_CERRI|nr:hypothetical protein KP509_30G007900 [Ceratopteris richardii]